MVVNVNDDSCFLGYVCRTDISLDLEIWVSRKVTRCENLETGKKNIPSGTLFSFGCASKLKRRGKPQILGHVSTYQGSILVAVF